jgi:hypothetical protein
MKIRFALPCALVALVAALSLTAASASAAPSATQSVTAAITPAQSGGALNGVFTIANFALNDAGQLVANGTFTGTLTTATGVTNLVNEAVSTVVNGAAATGGGCQVLDLTLGPLHLNLLGLVVDLNQVHLNITAQPGPGNLLGNLLCSVTHLLDNTSASNNALQNLVNRLNALLGGLGL